MVHSAQMPVVYSALQTSLVASWFGPNRFFLDTVLSCLMVGTLGRSIVVLRKLVDDTRLVAVAV